MDELDELQLASGWPTNFTLKFAAEDAEIAGEPASSWHVANLQPIVSYLSASSAARDSEWPLLKSVAHELCTNLRAKISRETSTPPNCIDVCSWQTSSTYSGQHCLANLCLVVKCGLLLPFIEVRRGQANSWRDLHCILSTIHDIAIHYILSFTMFKSPPLNLSPLPNLNPPPNLEPSMLPR